MGPKQISGKGPGETPARRCSSNLVHIFEFLVTDHINAHQGAHHGVLYNKIVPKKQMKRKGVGHEIVAIIESTTIIVTLELFDTLNMVSVVHCIGILLSLHLGFLRPDLRKRLWC